MLNRIRKSFFAQVLSALLVPFMFGMGSAIAAPVPAINGPIDVNFSGINGGDLVDVSTGNLNYNLPLLEVGGYPITLSYNPEISMETQASMVGLGWSISTGAINRVIRGIPDDFQGDQIKTTMNLRPTLSVAQNLDLGLELAGIDALGGNLAGGVGLGVGTLFDNYTGNETSIGVSANVVAKNNIFSNGKLTGNVGVNSSSRSGLSSNVGAGIALGKGKSKFTTSLGLNHNSLHGSSLSYEFGYTREVASKSITRANADGSTTAGTIKGSTGLSVGGVFPLGSASYTPTANFNFTNRSFSADIDGGGEIFMVFPHAKYTFTKTQSCLAETQKSQAAYGYMHLEDGYAANAIQDFNLAIPTVHEEVKGLNTPVPTYDYFAVSTQGATFRAVRNDAGYVKDPMSRSEGDATSFSGEIGFGGISVEAGLNVSYNWNNKTTGKWQSNNPFSQNGAFKYGETTPSTNATLKAEYEKFNFQKVSNASPVSSAQFFGVRGKEAITQGIYKANNTIKGNGFFVASNSSNYDVTNNQHYQHERRNRDVVFQHLTNEELRASGKENIDRFTTGVYNFDENGYSKTTTGRAVVDYPNSHIGEITIMGEGGYREVFGIPVMNESKQVSFNISPVNNYNPVKNQTLDAMGLVQYTPDDNSTNNKRGNNFFYLKNEVPAHATSYLLTQMLGADYADRTNDGPTPDDLGTYVKFNYSDLGKTTWRYPYQQNKATFNEGFKSSKLDDMASYQHGTRDVYLPHSIESKFYIAEFHYGSREDGFDVLGENGGRSTVNHTRKLEAIKLFTRWGKERGEGPIKTVHFEYDYELCPNTPDNENGGGKLTLKAVYFKNYASRKGQLYKYRFDYSSVNPGYDLSHKDRWGKYKQDNVPVSFVANSALDNNEFPYGEQELVKANHEVQAWKLVGVDLPNGSRFEVDYESDSYEYVQDYEATRMFKISGFYGWSSEDYFPVAADFSSDLYTNTSDDNFAVLVDLEEEISGLSFAEAEIFVGQEYMPRNRHLYFNSLLNLAPHRNEIVDPDVFEFIQGYSKVKEITPVESFAGSGVYDRIIITMDAEKIQKGASDIKNVHPFSRKAWQVTKEMLPLVLFPENDLQAIYQKDGQISCGANELESGTTVAELNDDSRNHKKNRMSRPSLYHMMHKTGYASRAVTGKSWVRLRTGKRSKIGGGSRVKAIRMYDNWSASVAGEQSSVYGTNYEYVTTNASGDEISSGVTSYEPLSSGADENAMREPHYYVHDGVGIPNEKYYTEFPLNEEIYAAPDVRYSEVKVSQMEYAGLTVNSNGYIKYAHYTARDYPLQFDQTAPQSIIKKPGAASLIGVSKRRFGFSYGTSIVANNMHGKFKGKYVYTAPTSVNPQGNLVNKVEHFYKEASDGTLSSEVPVIFETGSKSNRLMGLTLDLMTHLNFGESNTSTVEVNGNIEFTAPFLLGITVWPGGNTSESTIFSSLTTKVVYQSGILDRILSEDNGRRKAVKHLLFDEKTGASLATEIQNEQGPGANKLYDFAYPAHWAYRGMGLASENVNVTRKDILTSLGEIHVSQKKYFFPGDRLIVQSIQSGGAPTYLGEYTVVENESNGEYFLVDDDGEQFLNASGFNYLFRVFLPGRQSLSGVSMGNVSTLNSYPSFGSPYQTNYQHQNIVGISATEYQDEAKLFGNCFDQATAINPHKFKLRGQWKPKYDYLFDHHRDYTAVGTRNDGLLTVYQPFWKRQFGNWHPIHSTIRSDYNAEKPLQNWMRTNTATRFDYYGNSIETENAIGVKSAVYYGYNQQVVKANVENSRYEESGFDGFEDYLTEGYRKGRPYELPPCANAHFKINDLIPTTDEAHTGKYSAEVIPGGHIVYQSLVWDGEVSPTQAHEAPYQIHEQDLLQNHRFVNAVDERTYVLMGWIKDKVAIQGQTTYNSSISIHSPFGQIPAEEKRSHIIDGWQRVELTFSMHPSLSEGTAIEIRLNGGNLGGYFDDIRVHPFDSEMEATVVDPIELRPMATLDSRNFATIFQYDEDGKLVRTIQETERGKQTIVEYREGIRIFE